MLNMYNDTTNVGKFFLGGAAIMAIKVLHLQKNENHSESIKSRLHFQDWVILQSFSIITVLYNLKTFFTVYVYRTVLGQVYCRKGFGDRL